MDYNRCGGIGVIAGEAFLALAQDEWKPEAQRIEDLYYFATPFSGFTVNAYLAVCKKTNKAVLCPGHGPMTTVKEEK